MALIPTWFPRDATPATGGVSCATPGAGLPASFSAITLSFWGGPTNSLSLQSADTGVVSPGGFTLIFSMGGGGPIPPTDPTNSAEVFLDVLNHAPGHPTSVRLANSLRFSCMTNACYNQTSGGIQYAASLYGHFVVSIDFVAQTIQAYFNDQPMNVPGGGAWVTAAPVYNASALWKIPYGNYGEVWVAPVKIDLSITANRRQWINADLSAVQLPSNGAITANTGTVNPTIYLRAFPWQVGTNASGTPAIGLPAHPISEFLNNGGSGPNWTGTVYGNTSGAPALYSAIPPYATLNMGATQNNFARVMITSRGWGPPQTIASTTDLGFPATFRYALFAIWFLPAGITDFSWRPTGGLGGLQIDVAESMLGGNTVTITARSGSTVIGTGTTAIFSYGYSDYGRHVLVSVDTVGQIVQLYIMGKVVAVPMTWSSAAPMTKASGMELHANDGSEECIGDLYYTDPPAFYDLSLVFNTYEVNLLAFLRPQDFHGFPSNAYSQPMGSNGQGPTNIVPRVYLRAAHADVNGAGWAANLGTGGTFSPAPPLCGPAPPLPETETLRLAMDDVICSIYPAQTTNLVSLRWSDDRGHAWGSPVTQDIGEAGEYRTSLQWQRLGMARDRNFEVSWSVPMGTALQGCWIDVTPAGS